MLHQAINHRLYYWVPRTEVAYLQAVTDAYEGLVRVRTERHEDERSLVMFLVQESRLTEFHDVLRHLATEIHGPVEPHVAR